VKGKPKAQSFLLPDSIFKSKTNGEIRNQEGSSQFPERILTPDLIFKSETKPRTKKPETSIQFT
jgi:hypothetical protein